MDVQTVQGAAAGGFSGLLVAVYFVKHLKEEIGLKDKIIEKKDERIIQLTNSNSALAESTVEALVLNNHLLDRIDRGEVENAK